MTPAISRINHTITKAEIGPKSKGPIEGKSWRIFAISGSVLTLIKRKRPDATSRLIRAPNQRRSIISI